MLDNTTRKQGRYPWIGGDYQEFNLDSGGRPVDIGGRMRDKMRALAPVWPDMSGLRVLDVGCDCGYWSFLAANQDARRVLGVDRNRKVKGRGMVDLIQENRRICWDWDILNCFFQQLNVGREFVDLGSFDVVLCMSLYHHIYQNTGGDHASVWYWLWRQMKHQGLLIWENPVDTMDPVVRANVQKELHDDYTEDKIREAASLYFDIEYEGPAEHEPYRVVWGCRKKVFYRDIPGESWVGDVQSGAGGAAKAFRWNNGARIREVETVLGEGVFPGSLNLQLDRPFNWASQYFRTQIPDVVDRTKGLEGEWAPRPVRLYPVWVDGLRGYAMRFEGESYPLNFVEVLGEKRFRDTIGERVRLDQ